MSAMTDAHPRVIADLDVELLALIVDRCGALARPICPFISRKFAIAAARRRFLLDARVSDVHPCTHEGACKEVYTEALIGSRCLVLVIWAHTHAALALPLHACLLAASVGDLALLRWIKSRGHAVDEWTCASAARGGHLHVLQWARSRGCPWDVKNVLQCRTRRAPHPFTVGAGPRLPMGSMDVRSCRARRPS